ncbi:uncharacterized protein K02A2.6-like [Aedes albopictus]|uniref:RNA-directed DNA polymerase n=1 Tax=Aedes albopictus TaxID=7160 RepID=A0ABM1ZA27_AEDAL
MTLTSIADPYVPYSMPFSQYQEQLEWIFKHNEFPEDRYKTSFLAVCGKEVFIELKRLFPGKNFNELTYKQITDELKKRYDKNDSAVVHSYKFWTKRQGRNESLEDFVITMKNLAERCDFGEFKDRAIRDMLVIGVNDTQLQKRLCDEEDLSAAKAERLILNSEISASRTKQLNRDDDRRVSVVARLGHRPDISRSRNRFRSRSRSFDRNRTFSSRSRSNNKYQSTRGSGKPVYVCSYCKKTGHTRKFCYRLHGKSPRKNQASVKFVDTPKASSSKSSSSTKDSGLFKRLKEDLDYESDYSDGMPCLMISSVNKISDPCYVEALVNRTRLTMEIDCGSAESVIPEELYLRNFASCELQRCNKKLVVIDGNKLKVVGRIFVEVQLAGNQKQLSMVVLRCKNDFIPLVGRTWLDEFYTGWRNTFTNPPLTVGNIDLADEQKVVEEVKSKFATIFTKDFSSPIVGFKGDLILKEDTPIFKKAYEVPLRLRPQVIDFLADLEKQGVITPVEASEWASPVIAIVKKDQSIRLVIDCKVSINKVLLPNTYPLPVAQDLFATLSGSTVFCSLDLEGAYTQLLLTDRSKRFMVINTIKGLYTYNRLPQGASSSAAIFQKVMDQVLCDLENVSVYLDDVLIAGKDFNDCRKKLFLVLERLAKANIKVNLKKCKFFVSQLPYLGHVLTDKGLLPCPDKVKTIREAKAPRSVSELKAFLGLVTYYSKFIPNLSTRISCLYNLLKKNVTFCWTDNCEKSFNDCKGFLLNPNLLEYFDPYKPIVVVTDACSYGLGGVIAHLVEDEEKPISFTSFSLNTAQKNYPILHLEALAVVSTVKKFHKFLYGMHFTIYTDHKPLIGIFGKEGKNSISVTRLQRYVMELSIYDYDIVYRPSSRMGNADFCSRFPLADEVPKELAREYVKNLNFSSEFPIDYKEVAKETLNDEFLQTILKYLKQGWPQRLERRFVDVYSHYQELEEIEGCVLFQDRVVIPESMKNKVLKMLHMNHSGISKIKQLARRTVYWFGLNKDVEDYVKACVICHQMTAISKKAPYSRWIPTTKPFSRIHADFFHFDRKVFLVVVDSFTKWIELEYMRYGTDCNKVLKVLLGIFARFGLPDVVVTDGGPPFNSDKFVTFLENQGILVMKSPPYHPESNGQAERTVRLVKDVLKKFFLDPEMKSLDIEEQIAYFLSNYRNICLDKGQFPSERLLSYKPKTMLDLINPKNKFRNHLTNSHDDPDLHTAKGNKKTDAFTTLRNGDLIYYKNINTTDIRRWLSATFLRQVSDATFQISLGGRMVLVHKRQLKLPSYTHRKGTLVFPFGSVNAPINDPALILSPNPVAAPVSSSLTNQAPILSSVPSVESVLSSSPVRLRNDVRSTSKRRREEDEQDSEEVSNPDFEFYGYPADSFIFASDEPEIDLQDQVSDPLPVVPIRRSRRRNKKRRRSDFVYY